MQRGKGLRRRPRQRFVFTILWRAGDDARRHIGISRLVYGAGKVFSASEGIGERSWKMKRSKLSKRASTRWDELLVVR